MLKDVLIDMYMSEAKYKVNEKVVCIDNKNDFIKATIFVIYPHISKGTCKYEYGVITEKLNYTRYYDEDKILSMVDFNINRVLKVV